MGNFGIKGGKEGGGLGELKLEVIRVLEILSAIFWWG